MTWGRFVWGVHAWGAVVGTVKSTGDGWLIDDDGRYQFDGDGHILRDATVVTRCRIRLLVHRGRWIFDDGLGSRLRTIQTTKDANRLVRDYVDEALKPLLDDGSITAVDVGKIEVGTNGAMAARVNVTVPGREVITVGAVPIGAS